MTAVSITAQSHRPTFPPVRALPVGFVSTTAVRDRLPDGGEGVDHFLSGVHLGGTSVTFPQSSESGRSTSALIRSHSDSRRKLRRPRMAVIGFKGTISPNR